MRKLIVCTFGLMLAGFLTAMAQTKTPPAKLTFAAKTGAVTYDHAAHAKREKNDCKVCHTELFQQDAKAPLNFRPPHKNEEVKKTSCGFCHREGGQAFATAGNCTNSKCHVRPGAKKG